MIKPPKKASQADYPRSQDNPKDRTSLAIPTISKLVVTSGVGRAAHDPKAIEEVANTLNLITGQKPKVTLAKKAIASFKIRQGSPVGLMVTLRGKRMNDFLYRLINIVLPRVRDFRGLSTKSFDSQGNISLGIKEQIVFPEISPDMVRSLHGLEITIATKAKTPEEGKTLLSKLGFPFQKDQQ